MADTNMNRIGVLIGLKGLVLCKLTKDDASGVTYDTEKMFRVPGVIEAGLTAQVTSEQIGADDVAIYEMAESVDGYELALTLAAIGTDGKNFLLGNELDDNGVLIENAGDNAPYVAAGFVTARSDGSEDYVWLYKGKFAPSDETFRTKEKGKVNWQTPALKGTFGPRVHDRDIKAVVNSKETKASAILGSFFGSVYQKTKAGT